MKPPKINITTPNITYNYQMLENRPKTDMLVIHHTGNPKDDNLGVVDINISHQRQGWTCIGYHYVIRKDGTIEEGRPHWTTGAHAYGHNNHTIGIHCSGNFELAQPTLSQLKSLGKLIRYLCITYGLPIDNKHIKAHRDLMPTACCGSNLYNKLPKVIEEANRKED